MSVRGVGMASSRIVRRIVCRDTGNECDACFEGRNDDKLVGQAVEHLAQDHGASLTPELAARIRALIKAV